MIIDIPDDADVVIIRRNQNNRQHLYQKLDIAQQRAKLASDWIANCPCNPVNGGSGICGCVNPYAGTYCDINMTTSTTVTYSGGHCKQ